MRIAGLVPFSTVDWPGQLCAALFLQGCPWRCPYCHNAGILDLRAPGQVLWEQVETLLWKRKGLLDAVVFSGGEALTQGSSSPDSPLEQAMRRSRQLGYRVGLHTAGIYPTRLARLLDQGLVDWVGLDIKALPEDYQRATGSPVANQRAEQSLSVLADYDASRGGTGSDFTWEVRLTLWPALAKQDESSLLAYARQVAQWSRDRGARRFALQRYQMPLEPQEGVDSTLLALGPHWDEKQAMSHLEDLGFVEVCVR